MAKTQRLLTGRSSEFADQASGGGSSNLQIASIVKTDGNFASLNPIPGTTINFITGKNGVVFFSLSSYVSGFVGGPSSDSFGINVDGVDYTLSVVALNNGSGGDFTTNMSLSGSIGVPLAPGSHTAYLFGAASNLGFVASPNNPMTLTVIYPTVAGDPAVAASLVSQSTGPFTATINPPDTNYVVVPGSLISVVLTDPQTIVMSAYATFRDPGSNAINGQLGIRRTSPGPVVVDYSGAEARGGNDLNAAESSLTRTVLLPAGTHTFELIARNPASGGSFEYDIAFLTVIYNNPQEIAPVAATPITSQEVLAPDGDYLNNGAIGDWADVPGTDMTINLSGPQTVYFSGEGRGFRDDAQLGNTNTQLGISIDGVDFAGTSVDPATLGEFISVGVTVTKAIALAAGSHTIKLRFRRHMAGSAAGARILVDSVHPCRLTAIYTVPQAITPVPFSKFLSAARTAGDQVVASGTFIDVTGPLELALTDYTGGDILVNVHGVGEVAAGVGTETLIGLGLKVDGVEQATGGGGLGYGGIFAAGSASNWRGLIGYQFVVPALPAGPHTLRLTVQGGGTLKATALTPLRISASYN